MLISLFLNFFLLMTLSFLILPVITQIFNPIAEAYILGFPTKVAKTVNEMHLVTVGINIGKRSI